MFGFLGGFSAALGPVVGGLLIDTNWFDLGLRLTFLGRTQDSEKIGR